MTQKLLLIIAAIVVVLGLATTVVYFIFLRTVVPAGQVLTSDVEVSAGQVQFSVDFSSSALWFRGYEARFADGALYVRILGTNLQWFGTPLPVRVTIPTPEGPVQAVYLEAKTGGTVQIWKSAEAR